MTWKVPAKRDGGKSFEVPPAGTHAAVCVGVIDLGTQEKQKFESADTEWVPSVYLCWELVDLPNRPLVGREFRVSLHKKAGLVHFLKNWVGYEDGDDFDLDGLAGEPCFLTVSHLEKGGADGKKTYYRLEGATAPPLSKGQPIAVDDPAHEPVTFHVEDGREASLPDWLPRLFGKDLAEVIGQCRERRSVAPQSSPQAGLPPPDDDPDDNPDDIPF